MNYFNIYLAYDTHMESDPYLSSLPDFYFKHFSFDSELAVLNL